MSSTRKRAISQINLAELTLVGLQRSSATAVATSGLLVLPYQAWGLYLWCNVSGPVLLAMWGT